MPQRSRGRAGAGEGGDVLSYLLLAGAGLCFRPGLNMNIQRVRVLRYARCPLA